MLTAGGILVGSGKFGDVAEVRLLPFAVNLLANGACREPRARPEGKIASVRDTEVNIEQSAINPDARRLFDKNDSFGHTFSSVLTEGMPAQHADLAQDTKCAGVSMRGETV